MKYLKVLISFLAILSVSLGAYFLYTNYHRNQSKTASLQDISDYKDKPSIDYEKLIKSFKGPYKNEFIELAKKCKNSQLILSIISDEKITKTEMDEAYATYRDCMKKQGWDYKKSDGPDGYRGAGSPEPLRDDLPLLRDSGGVTFEGMSKEEIEKIEVFDDRPANAKCSPVAPWDDLTSLHASLTSNPNNVVDMSKWTVKCLIRNKIVPEDYSADDYKSDFQKNFDGKKTIISEYLNSGPGSPLNQIQEKCQDNPTDISSDEFF